MVSEQDFKSICIIRFCSLSRLHFESFQPLTYCLHSWWNHLPCSFFAIQPILPLLLHPDSRESPDVGHAFSSARFPADQLVWRCSFPFSGKGSGQGQVPWSFLSRASGALPSALLESDRVGSPYMAIGYRIPDPWGRGLNQIGSGSGLGLVLTGSQLCLDWVRLEVRSDLIRSGRV